VGVEASSFTHSRLTFHWGGSWQTPLFLVGFGWH